MTTITHSFKAPMPWRMARWQWFIPAAFVALLVSMFSDGVFYMVNAWEAQEYSHGFFIPLITAFLIWHKRERLATVPFRSSWLGVVLVIMGMVLGFLGEISTLYTIVQYGFLVALWGVVLGCIGRAAFKEIWVPLLFLFFMIPLPSFLYNNLSAALQLISSQLGVGVIRGFGIAVHLQGNVIDLGTYRLQVVEACSGLRYLFPLTSLAFLCAYLFKAPLWQRGVIFLSSIPITILMNSFRIGVIGALVEYWGVAMAEGFLHDFEGWLVFMACLALLLTEMWLLARLTRPRKRLWDVFGFHAAATGTPLSLGEAQVRALPLSVMAVAVVLLVGLAVGTTVQQREEYIPARDSLADFPLSLGEWQGRPALMDQIYVDELKFDDYVLINYGTPRGDAINFYVAYYGTQRKGQSAHSPRSCIPGDGWVIKSLDQTGVEGVSVEGVPLRVNRLVIEKGDSRQLVYYWFQQRGRVITNEYLVKWYLFWDALTRNRTDGALVRLTTLVGSEAQTLQAEARLREMVQGVAGELAKYVPGRDA